MPTKKTKSKSTSDQATPDESSPSSERRKRGPIDPEIVKLKKKHRTELKVYYRTRDSGAILDRVIKRDIPRMIVSHQEQLRDHLDRITTPPLPLDDPEPTLTQAKKAAPAEKQPPTQDEDSPWPAEMAEI
jgi:hypothetical protein